MLTHLRRLLFRPPPFDAALVTDRVVSVVGDVHGSADALNRLLPQLPGQIVLVGDLIDRGEDSGAVIDTVMARPDIICLMGNHEAMLLAFLDDPVEAGPRWLRNGGLQTLASFGVRGGLSAPDLPGLRDRLARAMTDARVDWLRERPLFWRTGNLVVTHAGADPARPIEDQSRTLLWGHPDCGQRPRQDGLWIAKGHDIVPEPYAEAGVIAVDTGAYAGGPLTAAILGDGPVRFPCIPQNT
jgi:serine/threonine protein phosphatase 1